MIIFTFTMSYKPLRSWFVSMSSLKLEFTVPLIETPGPFQGVSGEVDVSRVKESGRHTEGLVAKLNQLLRVA